MLDSHLSRPDDYEYTMLRAETHTELTELLNDAAENCWEPVHYAMWSFGSGLGVDLEKGVHFVILRRDESYYEQRVADVDERMERGDFAGDAEEKEWAQRFLKRAREDGYLD
jgi:hypothetical protein